MMTQDELAQPSPFYKNPPESARKAWYKKWWIWVIIVLALGGLGALLEESEDTEPRVPASVVGMTLDQADKALTADKWKVEPKDARDDRMILSKKNWVVLSQSNDDKTVTLLVEKSSDAADDLAKAEKEEKEAALLAEQAIKDEEKAREKELADAQKAEAEAIKAAEQAEKDAAAAAEKKIRDEQVAKDKALEAVSPSLGMAQILCEREGEYEFPFGFKAHSIMGVLAETRSEGNIFLKYEITVTNAFNAKQKGVMECSVNGVGDDVTLDYFMAY